MTISITLNGQPYTADVSHDSTLLHVLRQSGCSSVKQGCDTQNCGICTVWVDGAPVLSCTYLAVRASGKSVTTLEGVGPQASELGRFLAAEGAEQCGYCTPGFMMTVLAMERELSNPSDQEIRAYLAGNLCRCSGYTAQLKAVKAYLAKGGTP